jgi:hypothetical protein
MLNTKNVMRTVRLWVGRCVVRTVRVGDSDGPHVRRISKGSGFLAGFVTKTYGINSKTKLQRVQTSTLYIDEGVWPIEPPQSIQSNLLINFTLFSSFFQFLGVGVIYP